MIAAAFAFACLAGGQAGSAKSVRPSRALTFRWARLPLSQDTEHHPRKSKRPHIRLRLLTEKTSYEPSEELDLGDTYVNDGNTYALMTKWFDDQLFIKQSGERHFHVCQQVPIAEYPVPTKEDLMRLEPDGLLGHRIRGVRITRPGEYELYVASQKGDWGGMFGEHFASGTFVSNLLKIRVRANRRAVRHVVRRRMPYQAECEVWDNLRC